MPCLEQPLLTHECGGASEPPPPATPPHSPSPPPAPSPPTFQVTPQRWYCLAVVTAIAALQGGFWANFGPISAVVQPLFGWDDAQLALLATWGPVCYVLAVAPTAWLLDARGIRHAAVAGASLIFAGSALRCVHVAGDGAGSALMHAAQLLNGLAGPVAMSTGPALSASWFAPRERTAATAVVGVSNYGGGALTFILGPLLVPQAASLAQSAINLRSYMLYEAAISLVLLVAALAMPHTPSFSPAPSAVVDRTTMWKGLRKLFGLPQFWASALSYGMLTGFFQSWGAMLGPNMQAVLLTDDAEEQAGWIGFWGAIAGIPGGVILSVMADRLHGRKKALLLFGCAMAAVGFLGFALLCSPGLTGLKPSSQMPLLLLTSITGSLFANAVVPLYFELAVEATFPVSEGLTTSVLTLINNFGCLAFLLVQTIPEIGTAWMNWTLVGACVGGCILILPVKEEQRRLEFDDCGAMARLPE